MEIDRWINGERKEATKERRKEGNINIMLWVE